MNYWQDKAVLITGGSAGLSGLEVRCFSSECKGKVANSLAGVFGSEALDQLGVVAVVPLHVHHEVRLGLEGVLQVHVGEGADLEDHPLVDEPRARVGVELLARLPHDLAAALAGVAREALAPLITVTVFSSNEPLAVVRR